MATSSNPTTYAGYVTVRGWQDQEHYLVIDQGHLYFYKSREDFEAMGYACKVQTLDGAKIESCIKIGMAEFILLTTTSWRRRSLTLSTQTGAVCESFIDCIRSHINNADITEVKPLEELTQIEVTSVTACRRAEEPNSSHVPPSSNQNTPAITQHAVPNTYTDNEINTHDAAVSNKTQLPNRSATGIGTKSNLKPQDKLTGTSGTRNKTGVTGTKTGISDVSNLSKDTTAKAHGGISASTEDASLIPDVSKTLVRSKRRREKNFEFVQLKVTSEENEET